MNLEELVDKIESLVASDPNINTYLFDDPETVNELHASSYPLLLHNPVQDDIDPRANEQDYNVEFFLLDTYFQDDAKTLRQKYSDMQVWGIQLIQEMYDVDAIKDVDNVQVNRALEQYNDNLVVVQFNFTVRVHDCMRLLLKPKNLVATTASSSQIDLTWVDHDTTETNYEISRSIDNSTWTTIDTVASDSTSYSDTGLDAATLYYYRVRCTTSSNRSPYSNVDSDTTSA
jgi:hypothetical protein